MVSVPVSWGWSTSSVPPSRSRPRRGVIDPSAHFVRPAARPPRARMTTTSARRLRLADFLVELRATKASLTVLLGARGRTRGVVDGGVVGRRNLGCRVGGCRVRLLHRDGAPVETDGRALGDLEPGAAVVEVLDR